MARERADLDGLARDYGLTKIAPDTYQSPAGLVFRPITNSSYPESHRLSHVLMHGLEDPSKATHSVFLGGTEGVVKLVDEAWGIHGVPEPHDPMRYVVDFGPGRPIGVNGETRVAIVVKQGPSGASMIVSAYPVP